jgi:hypothetical protein
VTTLVPDRYRAVSVARVPGGLTEAGIAAVLVGRPAYRRTEFVVVRSGPEPGAATALVRLRRRDPAPLFSQITALELLAGPEQTAYLALPDLDVGLPSAMARAAREHAPQARCVVVEGRYRHISFILDPSPVRVRVLDVSPPEPAKLIDQVRRVLEVAEDLAPVELQPEVIDLAGLVPAADPGADPADPDIAPDGARQQLLFPCRGGGLEVAGATVSYLDEVPPEANWTLLGCARSQGIHQYFYGRAAPQVDTCPKALAAGRTRTGEVLLTKCCLREFGVGVEDGLVVVPWGASLAEILDGLRLAVQVAAETGS